MAKNLDSLNINQRLYKQLGRMLDQLEAEDCTITVRERIAALVAIGRIQVIFMGLRKEDADEPSARGSTVTKYARTFKTNAARGRAKSARRGAAAAAVVEFDRTDDEDDDI